MRLQEATLVAGVVGMEGIDDSSANIDAVRADGPASPPPACDAICSFAGDRAILTISPFRCRVWELHDRLEEYITAQSCAIEIASFEAHGQLIPALGRPLRGNPDYDVEVVCGARRLFVARHLGVPLQIEIREMSDQEALVAMDIENRHRQDTSPYERGVIYKRCLGSGIFRSQDELARALDVSPSQVSRLLKLTQLPAVLLNAFANPLDLRECWGVELYNAWQDDRKRKAMANKARMLAQQTPRPIALKIYRLLIAPAEVGVNLKLRRRDEVVRAPGGAMLFRIRRRSTAVAFLIPTSTSADVLQEACNVLSSVLRSGRAQDARQEAELPER